MSMKNTLLVILILAAHSVGVAQAYCNWGPNGDAASSVCKGGAQGGSWCNANKNQCEVGCGGKWCTTSTTSSGTCGGGNRGNGICSNGQCCSQWGWCGTSSAHCSGTSSPPPPAPNPVAAPVPAPVPAPTASGCPVGWQKASWTYYQSYAPCCPGNPNYDPNADTTECDDYSACDYTGEFAYIGSKSYNYVKSTNLIAFYTTNGNNNWYGNKQMLVSARGKTISVLVADTCGDNDCNGCCTQNAQPTGNLVDMEANTVLRNFGSLSNADGPICWKLA